MAVLGVGLGLVLLVILLLLLVTYRSSRRRRGRGVPVQLPSLATEHHQTTPEDFDQQEEEVPHRVEPGRPARTSSVSTMLTPDHDDACLEREMQVGDVLCK